jgi:hypothetical protein
MIGWMREHWPGWRGSIRSYWHRSSTAARKRKRICLLMEGICAQNP